MKAERWSWLRAGPLSLLLASLASPALAQVVTATVTGTVTDASGAVLKDATVTATNQGTGVQYSNKSNEAGVYTITGLPAGSYIVRAEATIEVRQGRDQWRWTGLPADRYTTLLLRAQDRLTAEK